MIDVDIYATVPAKGSILAARNLRMRNLCLYFYQQNNTLFEIV